MLTHRVVLGSVLVCLFCASEAVPACRNEAAWLAGLLLSANTGEKTPALETAAAWTVSCRWGELETTGRYSPVNKHPSGRGFHAAGGVVYRRKFHHNWFLSLGGSASHLDGGDYTKNTFYPRAGLGWRNAQTLVEVQWAFRERQTTGRVQGLVWRYREDFYPTDKRVGLRVELLGSLIRLSDTGANNTSVGRHTGVSLTYLVGITCCRRKE